MIDIESELFTTIATALRTSFPGIFVTGEYVPAPPSFPCVMIVEANNSTYIRTQTETDLENHANLMYEIDVFSNKATGKKAEARAIASAIDDILLPMGFDRTYLNPIPNQYDATIYRIKGRYAAIASKTKVIYRR